MLNAWRFGNYAVK